MGAQRLAPRRALPGRLDAEAHRLSQPRMNTSCSETGLDKLKRDGRAASGPSTRSARPARRRSSSSLSTKDEHIMLGDRTGQAEAGWTRSVWPLDALCQAGSTQKLIVSLNQG